MKDMLKEQHIQPNYFEELGADRNTPEHRLLVAIVIRAMLDYVSTDKTLRVARLTAKRYFLRENVSMDPFSFCWIAEYLSNDPERFMNGIRELLVKAKDDPTILTMRVSS